MSANPQICPECGGPALTSLGGNCPGCLMRLSSVILEKVEGPEVPLARNKSQAGRCLGDYELLEEIARGGMGVVYRARQQSLKRLVAVKALIGGQYADAVARKRFQREAEAVAALNHPNIVSIHEIGEAEGELFFAMDLVEGRSLAEMVRDKPLEPRVAARILKAMAEGVHYAHQKNVLHRDLKPSNVLVDAAGAPRITDFGLAKQITEDGDLTLSGQVLGTPNYMPPEQANPHLGATTRLGDIYSLGAILYHLLTARPPFQANSLTTTLHQVLEAEPIPVRTLDPSVPRDLETICARCLEKNPNRRYVSALELADELGRFLNGETIQARPIGMVGRLARWCHRRPRLAFVTISAVALLVVIAVGAPIAAMRINHERKQAEVAEWKTRQELYTALLDESRAAVFSAEMGHRVRTLEAIQRAAQITNTPELRQQALAALRLPDLQLTREGQRRQSGSPTAWALDPTFERFAECPEDGSVEIFSTSSGTLLARLRPTAPGRADRITWSADGKYLALKRAASAKPVSWLTEVWNTSSWSCVYSNSTFALRTIFHPNSRELLNVLADGSIIRWDLPGQRLTKSFSPVQSVTTENLGERGFVLAFKPDGSEFAESHFDSAIATIALRRTSDGEVLRLIKTPLKVSSIAWQPGGTWLALTELGGLVSLLDPDSGEIHTLGQHKVQAVTVTFSPDGHYLFSGGWENELICWDMEGLQKSFSIPANSYTMQFRLDGSECALVSESSWQVFKFARPLPRRMFAEQLGGSIRGVDFSPQGRWLAASGVSQLGIWDLNVPGPPALTNKGAEDRFIFASTNELYGCNDSGFNGWRILESSNRDTPPTLRELELPQPKGLVSLCAQGSNVLVLTSEQGSTLLTYGQEIKEWLPTASGISSSSPDGEWMAVFRPYSKIVHIYHLPELTLAADVTNSSQVAKVEFIPKTSEMIVDLRDSVSLFSTNTWTQIRQITNTINLIYPPTGRSYWLTKDYRTGGLYSASDLQPILPLPRGSLPMALSGDGRWIAVSTDTKYLEVWDLIETRRELRLLGLDWPEVP